jgi:hypothetical protein
VSAVVRIDKNTHIVRASLQLKLALSGWAALPLIVLVIAYFVVLGRTGGTVFQRLFSMKRAK